MSDAMDALGAVLGADVRLVQLATPAELEQRLAALRDAAQHLVADMTGATVDALRGIGQPLLTEHDALLTIIDVTRQQPPTLVALVAAEAILMLAKQRMGAGGA